MVVAQEARLGVLEPFGAVEGVVLGQLRSGEVLAALRGLVAPELFAVNVDGVSLN